MPVPTIKAGDKFAMMTILERAGTATDGHSLWLCQCDCGKTKVVSSRNVTRNMGCGCQIGHHSDYVKHGQTAGSPSKEYNSWDAMKQRCSNPNSASYKYYGARGIAICERWFNSFENFYADMGPKPSPQRSLDRINNDGNYEPSNCRWATYAEQISNRRPYAKRVKVAK